MKRYIAAASAISYVMIGVACGHHEHPNVQHPPTTDVGPTTSLAPTSVSVIPTDTTDTTGTTAPPVDDGGVTGGLG